MPEDAVSRRSFLAMLGTAPLALAKPSSQRIPVGLELYSVRDELSKDLMGTVRGVAKMGYEVVEFYSPYYDWDASFAKEVRKLLEDSGIRCLSTHNSARTFNPESLSKAIELNQILGSKFIVMASAGRVNGLDGWKTVGDRLSQASERLVPLGMRAGFHNHKMEFVPLEGRRPMEVIAAHTPKEVTLQLDVGTCVDAGCDPVSWIKTHTGRITSLHCKDWAAGEGKGYRVLFGEGDSPWKAIFEAAETVGGVEFYLVEQEGSRYPAMETAERCLTTWKKLRG